MTGPKYRVPRTSAASRAPAPAAWQARGGADRRRFFRRLHDEEWEQRALKRRMRHASEVLGQTLPRDYRRALGILLKTEDRFEGFEHLLFADSVTIVINGRRARTARFVRVSR
jgi:hypothetical protein